MEADMAKSKEEKEAEKREKEAEKARKKAEKEAKKKEKEKQKAEKALNKAEEKYKKAMKKAQKETDPEKKAKKEAKALEKLTKSYNKTTKKYPEATKEVLIERKEAQKQKMKARVYQTQKAPKPVATDEVQREVPQAVASNPQVFDGNSNAYAKPGNTDIYGNAIAGDSAVPSSSLAPADEKSSYEEPKTLEEAMARVILAVLEATLMSYMGPGWGYVGDRYTIKGQQFDSRIEEREQTVPDRSRENAQTRTEEDYQKAPLVGELHIGDNGNMTYTNYETNQSVAQNTNNQTMSVPQMIAMTRGGRG